MRRSAGRHLLVVSWLCAVGLSEAAPIHDSVRVLNTAAMREILAAEPDAVNAVNEAGQTPLHVAAEMQSQWIMDYLINQGADIQAVDAHGETAIAVFTRVCAENEAQRLQGSDARVVQTSAFVLELDPYAEQAWNDGRKYMFKVIEQVEQQKELPENHWLHRDRSDAEEDINDLLDQVLEALGISSMNEYRQQYKKCGDRIVELHKEILRYREDMIGAPLEKKFYQVTDWTRNDYLESIDDAEKQVQALVDQQESLIDALVLDYERIGIDMPREQVQFYLSSISGVDIVNLSALFHNVQQLNQKLEELMNFCPNDIDAAKRYYGLHVVMLKAVMRAHDAAIQKIDERYLPRLMDLEHENHRVRSDTRRLLENGDDRQRIALDANLKTQQITEQTISLYREHLMDLRERMEGSLQQLQSRYQVAVNAYETIGVASALAGEMQTCIQDMASLQNMLLPELLPLNSLVLQQKFSEMTISLQGDYRE